MWTESELTPVSIVVLVVAIVRLLGVSASQVAEEFV